MKEQHKKTINKLKAIFEHDSKYLALIISGSIADNTAKDTSDIDIYLVVTEKEFQKRLKNKDIFYGNGEICDYEGGYVDGKIVSLSYLKDAIDNANEPTRASFNDALIIFSKVDRLESIIKQISKYPEYERDEKIRAFHSQTQTSHYFATQALASNNKYLLLRSVDDMIFFGCRLLLAYNRILFPCYKSLFKAIQEAKEIPKDLMSNTDILIKQMNQKNIDTFYDCIMNFRDWGISINEDINLILENEMNWYTKRLSFSEW